MSFDFVAALSYLKTAGFDDLRNPALVHAFARRATLPNLISLATDGTLPYDLLVGAGKFLSLESILKLGAAIETIPESKRDSVAAAVAGLIASENLDAALKYASSAPSTNQASAYASILDTMVSTNGKDEAVRLYNSLPENLRNSDPLLFSAGKAFGADDPTKALSLLGQIQDATVRKTAILSYSRDIESRSPEAAIMAIHRAGLSSSGKDAHSQRIFTTWLGHDRDAATAFARTSTLLNDAERGALLRILASPSG
jgi:hypothetical protein